MNSPNAPFTPNTGYTYVSGYQYVTPPPERLQAGQLRTAASWLAVAILIHLVFSAFLPTVFTMLFSGFLALGTMGGHYSVYTMDSLNQFVNLLSYLVSYLVPFWLYLQFLRMPLRAALPLRAPRASLAVPGVLAGLGTAAIGTLCVQAVSFVCALLGVLPISPDFSAPAGAMANVWYVLTLVVAAPLVEEFVFRGAILQSLRRFGDAFALIISSFLFAVFHGNLVQAPNALLMGIVMGFFALRTGSLWASIAIHAVNNLASVLIIYLSSSMSVNEQILLNEWTVLGYALVGLAALIYLMVRHGNIFSLRPAQGCILNSRQKYGAFFTSIPMLAMLALFAFLFIRNLQVV